jgi:uncharacterized protein
MTKNSAPIDPEERPILISDARAELDPPLPEGFIKIGNLVHWRQSPSFTEVAALLEPQRDVQPGQFLGVWHGRRAINNLTVIQVGNSFEVNPNEVPDLAAAREALGLNRGYGGEGVSTRIFRLAECTTIEEFDLRKVGKSWEVSGDGRAPELLSRAGDPVVLLSQELIIQAIGGRQDPDSGIYLGQTYGSGGVPVTLTPEILQLHIGIFGNPGTGKSYLGGNLIEEAVAWNIPTLVLDINGEMIDAAKALKGQVITLPDPNNFGISLKLMTPQELVAITPNVQPNTIYAELIELAHDQLRNESKGRRITFNDLRARIETLGDASKAPKTSVGAALARISVLERDPIIGTDFDFVEQLKKKGLVVLDCRFLSLRQTQLIAAAGARELQRIGREMARKAEEGDKDAGKWFALYFVDEAHAVVPDDEHVVSTQVHYELARMGRHVRTGLILSSQSPQDLNVSVLKRLQMRFVFSLEKDQLRSIQGVLADLDEKILQQLPKLPRGICGVSGSGELVKHGFLLRVRERLTPVGGRTPKVFDGRKKSKLGRKNEGRQ